MNSSSSQAKFGLAGGNSAGCETVLRLLGEWWLQVSGEVPGDFLEFAAASIRGALPLSQVAVVRAREGSWETLASVGAGRALPWELLADALDRGVPCERDGWWASVAGEADPNATSATLLVMAAQMSVPPTSVTQTAVTQFGASLSAGVLEELARWLGRFYRQRGELDWLRKRIARQESILRIAATWSATLDLNELLVQMAEASTRLMQAERASIFLWDRPLRTLIARPALGVQGGELRIPDHQGIVGEVVRSGTTRVVDAASSAGIDRSVDKRLRFHTRNLLCGPLRARAGEVLGAFEMINKRGGEFTAEDVECLEELARHASTAIENSRQHGQLLQSRNTWADQANRGVRQIGECPEMQRVRATIERVGPTDLAVLVLGENGTGKEVVAQLVHALSERHSHPFVAINCAALPETLLESELFGHEKGAFTDAREMRVGKFEQAAGGTLFLDEIGDLSPSGQAKLLRVLEDKTVTRLGGQQPIHVDTRVIAATNQRLHELVRERRFREDLYYRLHVVAIELPPLRERGDDVLLLAEHFLAEFSGKARRRPPGIAADARRLLREHRWPGNVRELRNLMERIAFLSPGDSVQAADVSFTVAPERGPDQDARWQLPMAEATHDFQVEYIQRQIRAAGNHMSLAAERMGLHRGNLYRKMKQLGMPVDQDRPE